MRRAAHRAGRALQFIESPNEQVHAVQRTPSWRPVPKSPHAYAVTCLREGGGGVGGGPTLTANGRHERGRGTSEAM